MDIVTDVYKLTKSFPSEEKFGLTPQMRRCAVSIPSNVSEGAARNTHKEFINFLHIAQGSLSELDTQLEIALRLKFTNQESWTTINTRLIEENKMLPGLIHSIKDKK